MKKYYWNGHTATLENYKLRTERYSSTSSKQPTVLVSYPPSTWTFKSTGFILSLGVLVLLQPLGVQPSLSNSQSCPVTEQESADVAQLLQQVTGELLAPENQSDKTNNSSHYPFCTLKLSYVQKQASYLLDQFQSLKNDGHLFGTVKKGLEVYLSEFNKLVESTKISHQQPLSNSSVNFNINLAALQQQVNSLFSQVKELHGNGRESAVKLCIAYLKNGEPDAAYEVFSRLNDNTLLDKITRQSYSQKRNPDNVEDIVAFARLFPNCSQDSIVYSALFDEMKKYGNLNNPEVLTFYEATKTCRVPLFRLQRQLRPHVGNVISKWADKLRKNVTEPVNLFAEKGSFSKSALASNMPALMANTFSNKMSNFASALTLAVDLSDFSLSGMAFEALLSEMKKAGKFYSFEVLRLAYELKEKMELGSYFFTTEIERQFENLKNSLPGNVVNLIWNGGNCTVKNIAHPGFLYAANLFHGSDENNRKVFSWTAEKHPVQSFWAFETDNDGWSFQIKNLYWNEYLFSGDFRDSSVRWMFTSAKVGSHSEALWRIKPVNGSMMALISFVDGECAFPHSTIASHGHAPSSMGVYTWNATTESNIDTDTNFCWELKC